MAAVSFDDGIRVYEPVFDSHEAEHEVRDPGEEVSTTHIRRPLPLRKKRSCTEKVAAHLYDFTSRVGTKLLGHERFDRLEWYLRANSGRLDNLGLPGGLAIQMPKVSSYLAGTRRHAIGNQIERIVRSSYGKPKSMLLMKTTLDQGSVYSMHSINKRLKQFAKTHEISLLPITTRDRFLSSLSEDPNRYDRIVIQAHALDEFIAMNRGFYLADDSVEEIEAINAHIKDRGVIVLECCFTGRPNGVAEVISRGCPKATVYASQGIFRPVDGIEYNGDLIPTFYETSDMGYSARTGRDDTVILQNGSRIRG